MPPDTPGIRAALAAPQLFHRRAILRERLPQALRRWALERMGDQAPAFLEAGLWHFFLALTVRLAEHPTRDPATVATEVPFWLPPTVPRHRPPKPGERFVTPDDLRRACAALLPRVQKITRQRWRSDAAFCLAIQEALPGTTSERAARCRRQKASASAIVYDYVAWKYKLPVGGASVKKALRVAADPEAALRRLMRRLEPERPAPAPPGAPPTS